MKKVCAIALLFTAGCSSSPTTPSSCAREDWLGPYLFSYAERSGNCGKAPDTVVLIDDNAKKAENCEYTQPVITKNGCQRSFSVKCVPTASAPADIDVSYVLTLDDDGNMSGLATFGISISAGVCTSTYNVTAKRQ